VCAAFGGSRGRRRAEVGDRPAWLDGPDGRDKSESHWYGTFALILAPGLFVGALIALAGHRRRTGGSPSPWLTLSPCLFLAALADPTIFKALITNAIGGGAIGVVLFGLAGGYALSGRGHAWWRRTCGVFAFLGVLLMLVMASDTAPLGTAHGTWIGLYAASLIAILGLARAIPQRIGQPSLVAPVDRGGRRSAVRARLGSRNARVHVGGCWPRRRSEVGGYLPRGAPPHTINPGMRISFDPDSRTVVESCNAASSRPNALLIRRVRLTALMTAVEPQQPGYLSHSDAAAAPVDRVPQRQTLIVSHCPQRLPSAPLSVPDQSIAFTGCGQHGNR
jgi:hypothetical protein